MLRKVHLPTTTRLLRIGILGCFHTLIAWSECEFDCSPLPLSPLDCIHIHIIWGWTAVRLHPSSSYPVTPVTW